MSEKKNPEVLLKFEAHLYRPDGSKVTSIRAIYDDKYGPAIKWICTAESEALGRIEVVDGSVNLGGRSLDNELFEKGDILILPLKPLKRRDE